MQSGTRSLTLQWQNRGDLAVNSVLKIRESICEKVSKVLQDEQESVPFNYFLKHMK